MNKRVIALGLPALALGLAAQLTFTPAAAQSCSSEHFPNNGIGGGNVDTPCTGCGASSLRTDVQVTGTGSPVTSTSALNAGDSGTTVATNKAIALCTNLVTAGWTCPSCAFPSALRSCTKMGNDGKLKQLDLSQTGDSLTICPGNADTRLRGDRPKTNAGNTVGIDLLPTVLIRVRPNGQNGNVVFTTTGSPAGSFSVDSTGKTDQQLHDAIAAGFNSLLGANSATSHAPNDSKLSIAPADMDGFFVELHSPGVTEYLVDGQPGQTLILETSQSPDIPALSTWGFIVLAAGLLLMAFWLMRRSRPLRTA